MSHLFVQQTLSLYHDAPVSFRGLLNWHSPVQKIINKNSSSSFNCKGKSLHSEHHEQNSLLNACWPVENHNVFANIPFNNFSEEKEKKQLEAAYLYGLRCYIRIKHFVALTLPVNLFFSLSLYIKCQVQLLHYASRLNQTLRSKE